MRSSSLLIILLLSVSAFAFYENNSKVIKLTTANFQEQVINSKDLWLVEFYAPWCQHCKELAPEYENSAQVLEGIIKLGAVDMTTDQDVGGPYSIKGFPSVKFFGSDKSSPVDFTGEKNTQDIVKFAYDQSRKIIRQRLNQVKGGSAKTEEKAEEKEAPKAEKTEEEKKKDEEPSNEEGIITLDDDNFDSLVYNKDGSAWIVKFYAPWCQHCKELAPKWLKVAESPKLQGKVKVAKLDASAGKRSISNRIKIEGYPSILYFPPYSKNDDSKITYKGAREADRIVEWTLEQFENDKPQMFTQLISEEIYDQYCENFKGVCIITFLPHIIDTTATERSSYIDNIDDMANKFRGKPFSFLWAQGGDQYSLEEKFALGSGYPTVLAISAKKSVHGILKGSFSKESLEKFIQNMIDGREGLLPFKGKPKVQKTKPWDGKDYEKPKSEDL